MFWTHHRMFGPAFELTFGTEIALWPGLPVVGQPARSHVVSPSFGSFLLLHTSTSTTGLTLIVIIPRSTEYLGSPLMWCLIRIRQVMHIARRLCPPMKVIALQGSAAPTSQQEMSSLHFCGFIRSGGWTVLFCFSHLSFCLLLSLKQPGGEKIHQDASGT